MGDGGGDFERNVTQRAARLRASTNDSGPTDEELKQQALAGIEAAAAQIPGVLERAGVEPMVVVTARRERGVSNPWGPPTPFERTRATHYTYHGHGWRLGGRHFYEHRGVSRPVGPGLWLLTTRGKLVYRHGLEVRSVVTPRKRKARKRDRSGIEGVALDACGVAVGDSFLTLGPFPVPLGSSHLRRVLMLQDRAFGLLPGGGDDGEGIPQVAWQEQLTGWTAELIAERGR